MHISATVKHRGIEGLIGLFLVLVSFGLLHFSKANVADWTGEWLIVVIGFFVPFVIGDLLLLRTGVGELRASNENLRKALSTDLKNNRAAITDLEASNENLRNALSTSLKRPIPDLAILVKYGSRRIPRAEMVEVWAELCWLVQDNYKATNWIHPESIYGQPWGKSALEVQCCKSRSKIANIQKVLIVEDVTELRTPQLQPGLEEQAEAGIEIRYIEHAHIKKRLPLEGVFEGLDTMDFGVFDDRYILLWFVHEQTRLLTEGQLIVEQGKVALYSQRFDRLFKNSEPYTG